MGRVLRHLRPLCVLVVLFLTACSASETSITNPTAAKCTLSARLTQGAFASTGGTGTIEISGDRDCTWSATTESNWLVIEGPSQGQGEAQVPFRVAENPAPAGRQGALNIEDTRLPVAQEGAPCRLTVAPLDVSIGVSGGTAALRLSATTGCAWTAQPRDGWIAVAPPDGDGAGTVTLTVAANAGTSRTGAVVISLQGPSSATGGQTVAVRQPGAETPAPDPSPAPPAPTPVPSPSPEPPPTPAPTPPPAPEPSPVPPPAPSATVDVSGRLSSLTGACPNVMMVLDGYRVTMNANTEFRRGNCQHLRDGLRIDVEGRASAGRRVTATRVTLHR